MLRKFEHLEVTVRDIPAFNDYLCNGAVAGGD
jgi:hypothetical protein